MRLIGQLLILVLPFLSYAQQNRVQISGSTPADSKIKTVRVVKFSPLWRDTDELFEKKFAEDTTSQDGFALEFDFSEAGPLSISMLNKTASVYVTPGDKITLSVTTENARPTLVFSGANAAHYSYADLADEFTRTNNVSLVFNKEKGPDSYRNDVDNWRKLRIQFLTDYLSANKVSAAFADYAKNDIDYRYVNFLYSPLSSNRLEPANVPAGYFSTADSILKAAAREIKYFSNSLLALTYKNIIFSPGNYLTNFDGVYNNIMTQFKGGIRGAMLTNFIGVYVKQQSEAYRPQLIKAINASRAIVSDTTMRNYINRREVEYTKLNRQLPDEILNTTYLKKLNSNTTISLASLLSTIKDEPVYVDFWASWCSPCREDIANSAAAKEVLKSAKVRLVYISLDTKANEGAWKKASEKDQITADQYILVNDFKSPLAKYLNAYSIPRYVLLDKDHKLKNYEAPRLNPSYLQQLKFAVMGETVTLGR